MLTQQGRFEGSKVVRGVEYFSLTAALKHFRQEVEKGAGTPIQKIEINAALFLDDMMKWIGLNEDKRKEVLGKSAASFVASIENEPISTQPIKH